MAYLVKLDSVVKTLHLLRHYKFTGVMSTYVRRSDKEDYFFFDAIRLPFNVHCVQACGIFSIKS